MSDERSGGTYLFGDSDDELARLDRQAGIFAEATEDVLRRSGVSAGMDVLDVGCGAGHLTRLAATIVGSSGTVLGIDRSAAALEAARRGSDAAGQGAVRYEQADLQEIPADWRFDAIIGRFILTHVRAPAAALERMREHVRPGGVVAILELDIGSAATAPACELFAASLGWIAAAYRAAGLEPDMGSKLHGAFRAAGLDPQLACSCRVEAGPDALAYDYVGDSIGSLVPATAALGLAPPADVDSLPGRLRAASVEEGLVLIFPRLMGAWARVPADSTCRAR